MTGPDTNMPNYLYVYHGGGAPETPEEGEKAMKAWMDWFAAMGDAVVDAGNPVGKSSTVLAGGTVAANGGANPASGYSIVRAESQAEAERMAMGCPILGDPGGSIEIAPIIEMG